MPAEDTIADIKVVFQDPFNLKNLYKLIYWWLIDNEYIDSSSEKDMEILYSEQARMGDVNEYHIWWRTEKQPENTYFKYNLHIDFLGLGMKNTEVVKDDKKYKMHTGEITVQIKGILVVEANDKKGSWEKNFILRNLRNWYREKWYRPKIEQHEDDLYEDVYKLQAAVKEFLELHQYDIVPDLFYREKGYE